MTNVLFLPKWYPNKNSKSEGIFVRRHAEAVSLFCNVWVLYATADGTITKGFYRQDNVQLNGKLSETIFYYRKTITGINAIDKLFKLILYFFCIVKGYTQVKSRFKPNIIHVHVLLRTGIMALFFSWIDKLPFVYTEHWTGYHPQDGNYKGFLRKKLTQLFISRAACVMPVTEHLAKAMQAHNLSGHYQILPNVVNTDLFSLSNAPAHSKTTAIHISNFISRAKNVEGILEVMSMLTKRLLNIQLLIVGDGESRTSLEKKAEQLGLLDSTVFFTGPKMGAELAKLIQSADFLFLFSNFENQPCVIMEAMSCGKPILATTVGGIPEMVDPTRGILSPPKDVDTMAKNFSQMVTMLPSFDPSSLRKFAVQHYSYEVVGRKIFDVYQKTLQVR